MGCWCFAISASMPSRCSRRAVCLATSIRKNTSIIGFHPLGEHPHVHSISNEDRRSNGTAYVPGNGWHIDHTNALRPPKAIMLYAVQLPDRGGDTQFSNLALAYEGLPADLRRQVD